MILGNLLFGVLAGFVAAALVLHAGGGIFLAILAYGATGALATLITLLGAWLMPQTLRGVQLAMHRVPSAPRKA